MKTAEQDKERFQHHKLEKKEQQEREQRIETTQIEPKIDNTDLLPEEIRMQERMALLLKK